MAYGLTATSKIASDKQLAFVRDLSTDRVDTGINGETIETIMNVLEGKIVTSSEASSAITDLLKQPKVIKDADKIVKSVAPGLLDGLPLSNYAVEIAGEGLVFLKIAEFKGTIYLRQLVGAPGDFKKIKPVGARRVMLAEAIKAVGPKIAAARYGAEFTVCGACNSPLTDELSRQRRIGPVCYDKF